MDSFIPMPSSLLSLSLNFSGVSGSSERPLAFKKLKRVSVDAVIAKSFTMPIFLELQSLHLILHHQ